MVNNKDALSNEAIPNELLFRLLSLLTVDQLDCFVEHCEEVARHGHGQATITWRDYKPDLVYHQASDKA